MTIITTSTRGGHPGNRKHGTKRTKGGQGRSFGNHHENKRDISEERNQQALVRGQVITTEVHDPADIRSLLSDDRISDIIRRITEPFEDTFQDAWVKVLEEHPSTIEEVQDIARQCSKANASRSIGDRYKSRSIDAPLTDNPDSGTLLDVIPSTGDKSEIEMDADVGSDPYVASSTGKINQKGSFYLDEDTRETLKKMYPHDTIHAAIRKVVGMPPAERDKRPWYKWEDAIIRQRYPWGGARAVALDNPRSLNAINEQARHLGVKAGNSLNSYKPVADWLNVPEVAEKLGVWWKTAEQMIRRGDIASIIIPKYHQGRDGIFVTPEALQDYLDGKMTKTASIRKQIQDAVRRAKLEERNRLKDKIQRNKYYPYKVRAQEKKRADEMIRRMEQRKQIEIGRLLQKQEELEKLKSQKQEELEKLKSQKQEELEKLKSQKQEELNHIRELKRKLKTTLRDIVGRKEAIAQDQAAYLMQAKQNILQKLREERETKLSELSNEIDTIRKAKQQILEEFRKVRYTKLQNVIGGYNKKLKEQVNSVRREYDAELQKTIGGLNTDVRRVRKSYDILYNEMFTVLQENRPYRVALGTIGPGAKYITPVQPSDITHCVHQNDTDDWVMSCRPDYRKLASWLIKDGYRMRFVPGLPTCKKCLAIAKKIESSVRNGIDKR